MGCALDLHLEMELATELMNVKAEVDPQVELVPKGLAFVVYVRRRGSKIILSCGSTSSENCTYLVQGTTTAPPIDPCTFTICKTSPNICRIRLDFTAFSIAGPALGTVVGAAAATNNGGAIGDCTTDSFSITSPGNMGSPVICGTNTDQHMIVDASDQCHRASFDFGGTGTTRQFDIKVTQYACGDENGGPDGCLQYFKGNTGTFSSFNFPTTATSVTDSVTHLSNQCYTMCFRQEPGKCAICFQPVIAGTGMTGDQGSFGLSLTSDATIAGTQDGGCSEDYLQMNFSTISPSQQRPFRVIFKTDADEVTGAIAGANENEQEAFPGGIIGFHLNYALQDC
ncbi:hypothetical protein TCAL_13401 [Tigriopus californicus]|uniref:CUB domain-containing protein n=1 Tax=Tigriopus californicus TaxID=6832 RepID=A0A553N7H7_TIGCA|nr:hypothetical protein TCAL_13401 [Tigriopus californicus]